jgi:hypothetical protein
MTDSYNKKENEPNWKKPKKSTDEFKKCGFMFSIEYYLAMKKRMKPIVWDTMDGTVKHYIKCNMTGPEMQVLHSLTHILNVKLGSFRSW